MDGEEANTLEYMVLTDKLKTARLPLHPCQRSKLSIKYSYHDTTSKRKLWLWQLTERSEPAWINLLLTGVESGSGPVRSKAIGCWTKTLKDRNAPEGRDLCLDWRLASEKSLIYKVSQMNVLTLTFLSMVKGLPFVKGKFLFLCTVSVLQTRSRLSIASNENLRSKFQKLDTQHLINVYQAE